MKFKPVSYAAFINEVVLYCNPEMADITNRRGEVRGWIAYVRAANSYGDTLELHGQRSSVLQADVLPDAEAFAERLTEALRSGWTPNFNDGRWVTGRAVYGSDAYVAYGQDDDLALEARELAEEAWN